MYNNGEQSPPSAGNDNSEKNLPTCTFWLSSHRVLGWQFPGQCQDRLLESMVSKNMS